MKNIFAENIKKYRMEKKLSQDQLAQQLDVSNQAVSKWECAISYPDIEMLVKIADLFEVTVDELLREKSRQAVLLKGLPDDHVIRVVQCRGRQIINYEKDTEKPMRLNLDSSVMKSLSETKVIEIKFEGKAEIEGDLYGNVTAQNGLSCGNIKSGQEICVSGGMKCGNAKAGQEFSVSGGMNCGNVEAGQEVSVSGGTNCGNITGTAIEVKGDVNCGNITGTEMEIKGDVKCKDIAADNITCRKLKCKGDIYYNGELVVKEE